MRLLFVNQKPLIFLKACLQLSSLKPQRYFFNFYLNSQGQTVTYKFYSRHLMSSIQGSAIIICYFSITVKSIICVITIKLVRLDSNKLHNRYQWLCNLFTSKRTAHTQVL